MFDRIESSWAEKLHFELTAPYFKKLASFVRDEYKNRSIYPKSEDIFRAFDLCSFKKTRVIILGQDPYHGPGQADGLCFSVKPDRPLPPSLRNVFYEIARSTSTPIATDGNLERWAKQGVLLLNTTLTVPKNDPGGHQNHGWELFTDTTIRCLSQKHKRGLVFMLWGASAQKKTSLIAPDRHLILTSSHPSPLSAYRGFAGNNHFVLANKHLMSQGEEPIAW